MNPIVFLDLDGTLVVGDHAFAAAKKHIPNGAKLFQLLSDGIADMVEEGYQPGRPYYQAGDTLAVIAPFLLHHGITDEELIDISKGIDVLKGVKETIAWFRDRGQEPHILSAGFEQHAKRVGDGEPFIVSTALSHHAKNIGETIGVDPDNIHATTFTLSELTLNDRTKKVIEGAEKILPTLEGTPTLLKMFINRLVTEALPRAGYGNPLERVPVNGSRAKAELVREVARERGVPLSKVGGIGDGITDRDFIGLINEGGGAAVAKNANVHLLRRANVAIATPDFRSTIPIWSNFFEGGLPAVEHYVQQLNTTVHSTKEGSPRRENYDGTVVHMLKEGMDLSPVEAIHAKMRERINRETAQLA